MKRGCVVSSVGCMPAVCCFINCAHQLVVRKVCDAGMLLSDSDRSLSDLDLHALAALAKQLI